MRWWRERRTRVIPAWLPRALGISLMCVCVTLTAIGFHVAWIVALAGLLSIIAAHELDTALGRPTRFYLPPMARVAIWLAIPAVGIIVEFGVFGTHTRFAGDAILLGPVLNRLKATWLFLQHNPRARRALASVERFIGFTDVPKGPPALDPGPVISAESPSRLPHGHGHLEPDDRIRSRK